MLCQKISETVDVCFHFLRYNYLMKERLSLLSVLNWSHCDACHTNLNGTGNQIEYWHQAIITAQALPNVTLKYLRQLRGSVHGNMGNSIRVTRALLYLLNSLRFLRQHLNISLTFDLSSCQTGSGVQRWCDPADPSVTWAV